LFCDEAGVLVRDGNKSFQLEVEAALILFDLPSDDSLEEDGDEE